MARSDAPPPLRRLLDKREVAEYLSDFRQVLPDTELALLDLDAQALAKTPGWQTSLVPDLASLSEDAYETEDGLWLYPLRAEQALIGALAVQGAHNIHGARVLRRGLQTLAGMAWERRSIAAETLERYHEINLLYRMGETINARLPIEHLPAVVLAEAAHVIHSDVSLVVIDNEVQAVSGAREHAHGLHKAATRLITRTSELELADITTNVTIDANDTGTILCAPLKGYESLSGFIVVGRLEATEMFTASDKKLLMAIAGRAGIVLETYHLQQQELERRLLEKELMVGQKLQLSLLPAECPRLPDWEIAASYQAARQVGGDFYDFFDLPNGRLGMVIGDVTGKGVPAAMYMALSRTILRIEARAGDSPARVLERTNRAILEDNRTRLFLTAFYAILDPKTGTLHYSNAGHDFPIWHQNTGALASLQTEGFVLGAFQNITLQDAEIVLAPGEFVVFYTDGVTEARNATGELFEEDRLRDAITTAKHTNADTILRTIQEALAAFVGDVPQSDDLTLFVVQRQRIRNGDDAAI